MRDINELIAAGATFICNHSGGKDSQAMLIKLLEVVPASQIVVVHASLGDVEWKGALEHAEEQTRAAGLDFIVARAEKSLPDMVERRFESRPSVPSWPSTSHRQCTSDLKRNPIEREVRRWLKANGKTLVVNCMGLRAQESRDRAKREVLTLNTKNSVAGREWYDWLPIHTMQIAEVWATIAAAGQKPHPAYALGSERLSCVFCIMASKNDLKLGRQYNPDLFAKYVELEKKTGYTMHASRKSLTELTD